MKMKKSKLSSKRNNLKTTFYSFSVISLSILTLIYFEDIIKPLIFALMIWYLIKELKRAMGKIKIKGNTLPMWLRGILSFLVIVLILVGIFQLFSVNIQQFNNIAPQYRQKTETILSQIGEVLRNPEIMNYVKQAASKINIAEIATGIVDSLSSFFTAFMIILVYVIFMLLEEGVASVKLNKLFPKKNKNFYYFMDMMKKIDNSVRSYTIGMIFISFLTAFVSYIALLILGIDFPILWAFIIFILNFIPYLGPFISSILPSLLAVFQFGSLLNFVYVFIVLEAIQIVLGNFVQPKLMGKSLNISPLTVLVTLAFWGSIWGIVGMILATPITAIQIIIMAQFPATKPLAIILSEKGDFGDD
jgi:predicted PurR-regulated permease PerM